METVIRLNDAVNEFAWGSFGLVLILGAGIICSISQLISDMNELKDWDYQPMDCVYRKKLKLEKEDLMVYSCFDFNSKSIDEIVDETKLDLMTVLRSVLHLSDLGLIEESFLNQYIKV